MNIEMLFAIEPTATAILPIVAAVATDADMVAEMNFSTIGADAVSAVVEIPQLPDANLTAIGCVAVSAASVSGHVPDRNLVANGADAVSAVSDMAHVPDANCVMAIIAVGDSVTPTVPAMDFVVKAVASGVRATVAVPDANLVAHGLDAVSLDRGMAQVADANLVAQGCDAVSGVVVIVIVPDA